MGLNQKVQVKEIWIKIRLKFYSYLNEVIEYGKQKILNTILCNLIIMMQVMIIKKLG